MDNKNYIPIEQICIHYEVPKSFFSDLKEFSLINMLIVNNEECIEITEIKKLNKIMRLHFDLNINMEGINSVLLLLDKVSNLQNQINELNNKVRFHEHVHKMS